MLWSKRRHPAIRERSLQQLANEHTEVAQLLAQFGCFPNRAAENKRLLTSLKTSITTHISDFASFRRAVEDAVRQMQTFEGTCPEADRELLRAVVDAGDDTNIVLRILNRSPLTERLPFIERVPIRKHGETTWVAPVQSALLSKQPCDPTPFLEDLSALEKHFSQPHPAIDEGARMKVCDAISRVRRELKREKPYLPGVLSNLEGRLTEYEAGGIEPGAEKAAKAVESILQATESSNSLTGLAQAAETYLRDPALRNQWLSNQLLEALLRLAVVKPDFWPFAKKSKTLDLIRKEIAIGHYDKAEMIRRLRHLEQNGVYFSTFVYALLQTSIRAPGATNTHEFEVKSPYGRQASQGGGRV